MKLDFSFRLTTSIPAKTLNSRKLISRWIGAALWLSCMNPNVSSKATLYGLGQSQVWSIDILTPNRTLFKEILTAKPSVNYVGRQRQLGGNQELDGELGPFDASPPQAGAELNLPAISMPVTYNPSNSSARQLAATPSVMSFTVTVRTYLRYPSEWTNLQSFVQSRLALSVSSGYFSARLQACVTVAGWAAVQRATGAHFHRSLSDVADRELLSDDYLDTLGLSLEDLQV